MERAAQQGDRAGGGGGSRQPGLAADWPCAKDTHLRLHVAERLQRGCKPSSRNGHPSLSVAAACGAPKTAARELLMLAIMVQLQCTSSDAS